MTVSVDRRKFLLYAASIGTGITGARLLAACSPASPPATAGSSRVYRVGFLGSTGGNPDAFWVRLSELGYVEGRNLIREERTASDNSVLDALAAELVGIPVDVIVAAGAPPLRAAMAATDSIPIITSAATIDPVAFGLATSLARPSRNVTGMLSPSSDDIVLKRMELLVEAVPTVSRIIIIGGIPPSREALDAALHKGAAGYVLVPGSVRREDIEPIFERAIADGADGLAVGPGAATSSNIDLIVGLAQRYRLPAIYSNRALFDHGGLLAYTEGIESQLRTAEYVDRILRGTRVADLPFAYGVGFRLIVNMSVARSLGLTFPTSFLAQVDEVIE